MPKFNRIDEKHCPIELIDNHTLLLKTKKCFKNIVIKKTKAYKKRPSIYLNTKPSKSVTVKPLYLCLVY